MEYLGTENRIKIDLRSKLTPVTKYLIRLGQEVRKYRENKKKWEGPFEIARIADNVWSTTDGIKVKTFNISAVLSTPSKTNDPELRDEI